MEHFKYQYRVLKTNKKTVVYHFDQLDQLDQYGTKIGMVKAMLACIKLIQ